uniref:ATP synthase F0 subunit 8 n=1 Tax=Loxocephala perpunctata TaxID=2851908 RepID=A0A8F3FPU0_9HEMI|nr:ATP synthase F0 subunit 8 [Loxocephala perpunctata]
MPQMSPIMWTIILIITNMLIFQMNSMNMYNSFKMKKKTKIKKMFKLNWKW